MRSLIFILLLVSSVFYSGLCVAHKMKSAYTIVLFNERTGNLEVMHRFTLHDAEEAAWTLFDKGADIVAKEQTQAKFANYVEQQFGLKAQDNTPIPLTLVGYQNDAGYFWVYQETKIPENLTALKIKHNALREVWVEQINTVNIEGRGEVQSISFSDSDRWLQVSITP